MSENTPGNGTAGTPTVDPTQLSPELLALLTAVDPEQLAALKKKDDERKAKLAAAAAERKRTNNRGKMPDGTTDRNAQQAYLNELSALLRNWVEMYVDDPSQLFRRLTETLIPSITAMSNTASTQMGAGMDTRRQDLREWRVANKAKAPAAQPSNTK